MLNSIKILILEDDIETQSILLKVISGIEKQISPRDIETTLFSQYEHIEQFVNKNLDQFDLILLDRDCKRCGSFHLLDIEKFGPDKIVSISSTPQWNKEASERGVKHVVLKDYANLGQFAGTIKKELLELILGLKRVPLEK